MITLAILEGIDLNALSHCTFSSWQPKIGDPNFTGWLTVVFYLVTFGLCTAVAQVSKGAHGARRTFWLFLSILMLFLAINKQLDLQSLATATARCLARLQGWYDDRAAFQMGAIASLGIIAMIVGVGFLWMLKRDIRQNFWALAGLTIVLGFVMIRAVGFHYFDVLIGMNVGPIQMNNILEFSGLVLISLNAISLLRQGKPEVPGSRRRRTKQSRSYRREH